MVRGKMVSLLFRSTFSENFSIFRNRSWSERLEATFASIRKTERMSKTTNIRCTA
jgi:hypothetical protein